MRTPPELYDKMGKFLWTIDGGTGMYWNHPARSKREWSATQPTHIGWNWTANGEQMNSGFNRFRNLTYEEFCADYGLDPLAGFQESK